MSDDTLDLVERLKRATSQKFRESLLAKGQARAMIRRDGKLPEGAPQFSQDLEHDLLNYGYSLMAMALRILDEGDSADDDPSFESIVELKERNEVCRNAFLQASYALEAATRNADPQMPNIAFHRLIAGAASHLAGYSARAFSFAQASYNSGRLSPMELTLADLFMRNLDKIEERVRRLRSAAQTTDQALAAALLRQETDLEPQLGGENDLHDATLHSEEFDDLGPMTLLLSDHYLASVSTALYANAYGLSDLRDEAREDLKLGEAAADDISAPGPWWIFRLTRHIFEDLDSTSIENNLPTILPNVRTNENPADIVQLEPAHSMEKNDDANSKVQEKWQFVRHVFIASLMARSRSEIDLWPSQLDAVKQVIGDDRSLVVSLPTSAGKTRIAELAILHCLAEGHRAIYMTPLRALSSQTETLLTRTFSPLGVHVSSLYGSIGVDGRDEDTLRSSDIVVTTPEKLDFALRTDPTILDDVGVVILDEGHMIGAGEREIRYETQIQRLLRRKDATARRLICLSAVFPEGQELDEFVGWVTGDAPNGLYQKQWRPTLQRFGVVAWQRSDHARLSMTIGDERPFIPSYFNAKKPTGKRRKDFPKNQNEMTLATAWQLIDEGQSVMIFCPLRRSVTTLAKTIVELHKQRLIHSILPEDADIADAVAIGTEWFGADSYIVKCLKLGIAIHHGALPTAFRKAIEELLHRNRLKLTVSSPTLAQGLNLSASVLLFSGLYRNKELISGTEFSNVIGRAGRAFVDTEGLVLYPIFEPDVKKLKQKIATWNFITQRHNTRQLESGLILISKQLLERISQADASLTSELPKFLDYLTSERAWSLPTVPNESEDGKTTASQEWTNSLSTLDTAILSSVGDEVSDIANIIQVLSDALHNSLCERQLQQLNMQKAQEIRSIIEQRAKYLWDSSTPMQRRGWYLSGLGAGAGRELAAAAPRIVRLTVEAEDILQHGDQHDAIEKLIELAHEVFAISTFAPTCKLKNKIEALTQWLKGGSLNLLGEDQIDIAQFIEQDVTYRLVWGIEAARVYEGAQEDKSVSADLIHGLASMAFETGTTDISAALLIRSGFNHREAAIKAVKATSAIFSDESGMWEWLNDFTLRFAHNQQLLAELGGSIWTDFIKRQRDLGDGPWKLQTLSVTAVKWSNEVPDPGKMLRVTDETQDTAILWSAGFDRLGTLAIHLNHERRGILHAISHGRGNLELRYTGPNDLLI
ncbi:DEAD/DEAH box helicase [Bifidobacterium mongoliense]|uniref:DEAD/DEAH box helicase n=1 Tax=Bifidobacterium mongoliense TaxID=518643 RepID=UPI0030EC9A76